MNAALTYLQHRQESFVYSRTLAIDNHMHICTIDSGIKPVYSTTTASVCIYQNSLQTGFTSRMEQLPRRAPQLKNSDAVVFDAELVVR